MYIFCFNPNRAEIFSHLIQAGGGEGSCRTSPLSPVIAVIKGQKKANDHQVLQENKL